MSMKFTVAQITLISLILVTAMGIFLFAGICGGAGIQVLSGMKDCPTAIQHHLSVFVMLFAATIIAMEIISSTLVRVLAATIPNSRIATSIEAARYESLNGERRNSTPYFVKRLISRGIFQKREDSDSSS